jgi:S-formylglutathione hydrolase FrmB
VTRPDRTRAAVVTRRAFLATGLSVLALGGAAEAVNAGLVPGRTTMFRLLGLNGPEGTIPDVTGAPVTSGSFESAARGLDVGWSVAAPADMHNLPVVVALHGYGGTHASLFGNGLGLDRFLAAHLAAGGKPFAIASIDGGSRYWHPRRDGDDPAAMVTDEFLPRLEKMGFDTGRLAFTGYSMGGYGALRFGWKLGPDRVKAVTALSPALWTTAGAAATVAFDSPADYAANSLYGRQDRLAGIPTRIDCGTGDGFQAAVRTYVEGFREPPAGGFEAGGHDMSFWRREAPAHLRFLAENLHR